GDQPEFNEVGIWPALMVDPACTPAALVPFAQDASQSLPYPLVQRFEGCPVTVLEESKPAGERAIDVLDDVSDSIGPKPSGFVTQGFFKLVQAFLARPTIASLEMIAQEVETPGCRCIDDARFGWVQRKTCFVHPCSHFSQRFLCFFLAGAQDYEVIRVAHHLSPFLDHEMVQRVEIYVCQ